MSSATHAAAQRPRVLIAADRRPTRVALRLALGCEAECSEATTGQAAVAAAGHTRPDVCLVDLAELSDGLRTVGEISQQSPSTAVVVLTGRLDESELLAVLGAGAAGYLLHAADPARVRDVVRGVMGGEVAVPRRLVGRLLAEVRVGGPEPSEPGAPGRVDDALHGLPADLRSTRGLDDFSLTIAVVTGDAVLTRTLAQACDERGHSLVEAGRLRDVSRRHPDVLLLDLPGTEEEQIAFARAVRIVHADAAVVLVGSGGARRHLHDFRLVDRDWDGDRLVDELELAYIGIPPRLPPPGNVDLAASDDLPVAARRHRDVDADRRRRRPRH